MRILLSVFIVLQFLVGACSPSAGPGTGITVKGTSESGGVDDDSCADIRKDINSRESVESQAILELTTLREKKEAARSKQAWGTGIGAGTSAGGGATAAANSSSSAAAATGGTVAIVGAIVTVVVNFFLKTEDDLTKDYNKRIETAQSNRDAWMATIQGRVDKISCAGALGEVQNLFGKYPIPGKL